MDVRRQVERLHYLHFAGHTHGCTGTRQPACMHALTCMCSHIPGSLFIRSWTAMARNATVNSCYTTGALTMVGLADSKGAVNILCELGSNLSSHAFYDFFIWYNRRHLTNGGLQDNYGANTHPLTLHFMVDWCVLSQVRCRK